LDQFRQNRRRYLAAIHNQSSAQHWEVFPQRALGAIDVNFFASPSNPNLSGGMRKLQKTALKIEQLNFSDRIVTRSASCWREKWAQLLGIAQQPARILLAALPRKEV
jgi:hypothetical protein